MPSKPRKRDFLELVQNRKTTYEFSDKKVKDSDLKKILEAGRWAPSCSNTQPWHFIIVKNKSTITRLVMTANYGDFHTDPSVMIALVLLNELCPEKGNSCFRGVTTGVFDAHISVGMTGLNMILEAENLGISSCLMTPYQEDAKKILKVKTKDSVILLVGLGYQGKKAFQKKRSRRKLSESISYELFGKKK